MDDGHPSISEGSVGSRFVSQNQLDTANAARDAQWKAAYQRLGQEPPPKPQADASDGRSLAEKLAANRVAKQEEWEERNKLANQFRALEEDEVLFLDTIKNEQEKEELKRKRDDDTEVEGFKSAIAARQALPDKPPTTSISPPNIESSKPKATHPFAGKRREKNALKGVVVKKKRPFGVPETKSDGLLRTPQVNRDLIEERPSKERKVSNER